MRGSHALPAGPRPDRAFEAVPAPEGKTQVFIDPAGDHYRTHATAAPSRPPRSLASSPRALRLNEDRPRRSGSGTTWGTRRSGTPARTRSTTCSASASAVASGTTSTRTGSRAHSTSLHETCDGILTHTGEREPGRSGEDRAPRRPRRTTSTTSTTRALRGFSPRTTSRARRSRPSARPAPRGSTGSSTTSSTPPRASTTSASLQRWGRRCSRCARSCSNAVPRPRRHLCREGARRRPPHLRPPRRARRRTQTRSVDYIAGMTDRFALDYADSL